MGKVARREHQMLETLDDDEVFAIYLELGSLKKLLDYMGELFELKSVKDGEPKPMMTLSFYHWLDAQDGRRSRWDRVMEMRKAAIPEEIIQIADDAKDEDVQRSRLKVDARYKAGSLMQQKADAKVGQVQVNINMAWLEGMRKPAERIPEADYEIEPENPDE